MMKLHKDSHLDHGLSPEQVDFLLKTFADRDGFFIASVELPVGTIESRLYGPKAGDAPVAEAEVHYARRGDRKYPSRMVHKPGRNTSTITVIAGPHDGESCILYTAFGGPPTPREPGDETLPEKERQESLDFWSVHALAVD